jgi:endogenous inhibitor of DNA gyrase (YacG/DUF329 family)
MSGAPPELKRLIEIANFWGNSEPISVLHLADVDLDLVIAAKRVARGLPIEVRRFIGAIQWDRVGAFITRWDEAYTARALLDAAVRSGEQPVDLGAVIPSSTQLKIDAVGRYSVVLSDAVKVLQGVDARLAKCRECGDFTWMSRRRERPFCSRGRCRQADWRRRKPNADRENQARSEARRLAREASRRIRSPR